MSIAVDPTRAIQKFDFEAFPGRTPNATISNRLTDISVCLQEKSKQVKSSDIVTIPVTASTSNFELSIFIPASSLVTSLGIFFTENCDVGAAGVLSVGFGNASADVSIVASTALNAAGADITINSFTSTSTKHKIETGGNAIAMAPGSALWFGNASSLFFQTIVSGNVLAAECQVKVIMEFVKVSNS